MLRRPALGLVVLVAASTTIRSILAWRHATARYFRDEYIYAALGRSIGHGHLQIRGVTAPFPAILEPILASPIWRLFPTVLAYHLVQVENALAASLAAVPLYFLARFLGLRPRYSFLCAVYGLLIPSLAFIPFTIADLVAYPLALAALLFGVQAIDEPTRRRQILFFVFAVLASLARVQYLALVPAYLVGAAVVERRRLVSTNKISLFAAGGALVAAGAIGTAGYYSSGLASVHLNGGLLRWFFIQPLLLTLEAGVVIVPGAIAAMAKPVGRRGVAFAAFGGSFAILLLAVTAVYADDSSRFKERYLFVLLALLPIAFGLYLEHGRPRRALTIGVAIAVAIAVARLPISSYSADPARADSQFLSAVGFVEDRIGAATGSLVVAVLATAAAAVAVAVAVRGLRGLALVATFAVAVAVSVAAVHVDLATTSTVRAGLPRDLTWVDASAKGRVTAIATPYSLPIDFLLQLYWNTSIEREVVLSGAVPTDTFSAPKLDLGSDGTLLNVRGDVLFDDFGTTGRFSDASRVAHVPFYTLWRPHAIPRFRLLISGRFFDDWLSPSGRIRVWPLGHKASGTRIAFRLSLPSTRAKAVRLKLGRTALTVRPGQQIDVACADRSGALDLPFSADNIAFARDARPLSVRMTHIRLKDEAAGGGAVRGGACRTTS